MADLRAYTPSLRDRIAWGIAGGLGRFGADKHRQRWAANKIGGLIDFVPGVGDAVGLDDAWNDYQAGNYGLAAAGLGLAAIGAVPGVGDAVATAGKRATNYLRDLGHEVDALYREMNAQRALDLIHGSINGPFGQEELYWANVPELALGQGDNKGIRVKMSPRGVEGKQEIKSKPGLAFADANSGWREYVTRGGGDFSKVDEVTVDPLVMADFSGINREFKREMRRLVDAGLFVEESPDAFVTVFRRVQER